MTVKSVRGRRRYIAFVCDPSLDRPGLISLLNERAGESAPYVVQCSEGWCILRCTPTQCDDTIALMCSADGSARSLRTSGTLRTLRARYPRLHELRPPPKRK